MKMSLGDTVTVIHSILGENAFQASVGDVLTVLNLDDQGNWAWCRNKEGEEDYVATSNLKKVEWCDLKKPPRPPPPASAKAGSSEGGSSAVLPPPSPCVKAPEAKADEDDNSYDNDQKYYTNINDAGCDKIFARNSRTGEADLVNNANVTVTTCLEQQPWYFEELSKANAEQLLKEPSVTDGTYLVKKSINTGKYVLCFRDGDTVRHRAINTQGKKMYAWRSYMYDTLTELVQAHSNGGTGEKHLSTPYSASIARQSEPFPPPLYVQNTPTTSTPVHHPLMTASETSA